MPKAYKHLFFDLDHTLWDFDRNSELSLSKLYGEYDLASRGITDFDALFRSFNTHNDKLWDRYRNGNKRNAAPPADKVRLYLPGGMRVEKGVQMLTEAMEILVKNKPELSQRLTLVTQFLGNDEILAGYQQRLAALNIDNQFLKHLTTEEYNHQLSIADVILIPYKVSEGYRARTSGILAEAIASAKPFVTTDGTWMALQARKYDTGKIVQDTDAIGLAEAIAALVASYSTYEQKAGAACARWMKDQSKGAFFELLSAAYR